MSRGLGNLRIPVLKSLNLIHYKQLSGHLAKHLHIVAHGIVRDDFIKSSRLIQFLTFHRQTFHYNCIRISKFINFLKPLIFQRSRTQNQHRRHQTSLAHKFCRADSLNGLAQSHFVRDNRFTLGKCESDTLSLIRIETRLEQSCHILIRHFRQILFAIFRILFLRQVIQDIRIAFEIRVDDLGLRDEFLYGRNGIFYQFQVLGEVFFRQCPHFIPMGAAYAEKDFTTIPI